MIDLRSDASTLPTAEMREAMASAVVGNDDFDEDPTIRELEEEMAAVLGKPAAVFVQSGTMGNMAALLTHLQPGQTILTCRHFHIYDHEGEAARRLSGCEFVTLEEESQDGFTRLPVPDRPPAHCGLVTLENSVNRPGGTLLRLEHMRELQAWARSFNLPVHLDGARLFNAAEALQVDVRDLAECADTVMVVFTKALSAPAGAMVAGDRKSMERARHFRWMLGGSWKQGGVLAAACLVGLRTMRSQIGQDHRLARRLAIQLAAVPGLEVDPDRVVTNIFYIKLRDPGVDPGRLQRALAEREIRIASFKAPWGCRIVLHKDVPEADFPRIVEGFAAGMQVNVESRPRN